MDADGRASAEPVWFLWEGAESVKMFSREGSRGGNVEANPAVS